MRNLSTLSIATLSVAVLTSFPVGAATLNIGGQGNGALVDVKGADATNPTVDLLSNSSTAPNGVIKTNALNSGGGPTTASVTLGGDGRTNGDVLLDLFGADDGTQAVATVGTAGVSGNGTGAARVELFGGSGAGTSAQTSVQDDLFGTPAGNDDNASNGGGQLSASGDGSISLVGTAGDACFTPTANQLDRLVSRHDYGSSTAARWMNATSLKVVTVGLCDRASITSAPGIGKVQALAESNPMIVNGLRQQGHSPNDVIAVDENAGILTVYVI